MDKLLDIARSLVPNLENQPNLSSISGFGPGWIFGALGTIMILVFSLSIGRTRVIVSLLSLYIALVFELIFPYWQGLNSFTDSSLEKYWLKLGLFVIAYLAVFIVFNLSFIKKRVSSSEFSLSAIIILSALQLGFTASIIFNILPSELALKWSLGFNKYFATQQALFIWALAPLPVLLFIGKK